MKDLLMDVGKTTVGILIANSAKIPERLDFGDNFAMRNASTGMIYYGVSEAIDYVSKGSASSLMSYDPLVIGDDIVFYSLLSAGAELSATDAGLQRLLSETAGLSSDLSAAVVEGAIVSGGRYIANWVDQQADTPDLVKVLRHPLKKILGHAI